LSDQDLFHQHFESFNVFANPWDDRKRFHQAGLYCLEAYNSLLPRLAGYLNHSFRTDWTDRYWKILIGPWLMHYIDLLYDSYVLSREIIEGKYLGGIKIPDEAFVRVPNSYEQLIHVTMSHGSKYYQIYLISQLLSVMEPDFPGFGNRKGEKKQEPVRRYFTGNIREKTKDLIHWATHLRAPQITMQGQLNPGAFYRMSKAGRKRYGRFYLEFPDKVIPPREPDSSIRLGLGDLTPPDEFESLLFKTLPNNFPSLYLEGYARARNHITRTMGMRFPETICSIGGLYGREAGKFFTAEATAQGTFLVNAQHGGGYGVFLLHELELHERSTADIFGCWGWAGVEQDPALINMPSVKLSQTAETRTPYQGAANRILMVGMLHPKHLFRFQNCPVGSQWLEYFEDAFSFFDALGQPLFESLVYRRYMSDFGWNMSDRFTFRFPSLRFDNMKESFQVAMHHARLLIFDNNATTYLEALSANVPTIIFFRPNRWEIRHNAQPFFDALKKAGILFETPQSAADQVRSVYPDIQRWWQSDPVQEARTFFIKHLALSSLSWTQDWANVLESGALPAGNA